MTVAEPDELDVRCSMPSRCLLRRDPALYPERTASAQTRSYYDYDCRTLVLKEFKAHRNYDSWFAGGSEFFVKCGALNGFSAKTVNPTLFRDYINGFEVELPFRRKASTETGGSQNLGGNLF